MGEFEMAVAGTPLLAERDLASVAFPELSEEQMEGLRACPGATRRRFLDGEFLVRVGDHDGKFFVVESGEIEIVDVSSGEPRTLAVHHARQFTGEVTQLTGGHALTNAIARGACEALEITRATLQEILNHCPTQGDTILQAFIARRQLIRQSESFVGLRVIGSRYSHDTFRIREFLARNRVPFTWMDLETDPDVGRLLESFGVSAEETPVVSCTLGTMRNPSNRELAEASGIRQPLEQAVYDLAIVGSGPAGLAAAVYGASEGLSTVVLESLAPGGQAGNSMRIENYLGFPTGVTGSELADRAVIQANRFGARLNVASPVTGLTFENGYPVLTLEDDASVVAKCLLIATGAEYRRLEIEDCARYEGQGVFYAATFNETSFCKDRDAIVVGGGNSAGQAAVFLSASARTVHLVVRGDSLHRSMSSYLARRIEQIANVEVCLDTVVASMHGERGLERVELEHVRTRARRTVVTPALFSFIGAVPRTDWLPPDVVRDDKGFVLTGEAVARSGRGPERRAPFLLETSHPGVFATGDVRSGSVKRVASAVGEGSMAVQFVHEFLKGK
jgi:thioredoxin reductase (NADPH)